MWSAPVLFSIFLFSYIELCSSLSASVELSSAPKPHGRAVGQETSYGKFALSTFDFGNSNWYPNKNFSETFRVKEDSKKLDTSSEDLNLSKTSDVSKADTSETKTNSFRPIDYSSGLFNYDLPKNLEDTKDWLKSKNVPDDWLKANLSKNLEDTKDWLKSKNVPDDWLKANLSKNIEDTKDWLQSKSNDVAVPLDLFKSNSSTNLDETIDSTKAKPLDIPEDWFKYNVSGNLETKNFWVNKNNFSKSMEDAKDWLKFKSENVPHDWLNKYNLSKNVDDTKDWVKSKSDFLPKTDWFGKYNMSKRLDETGSVWFNNYSPKTFEGPVECGFGPLYWCQNLINALKCYAIKHCIQTNWNWNLTPAAQSPLIFSGGISSRNANAASSAVAGAFDQCSFCENLITNFKGHVLEDSIKENLRQRMQNVCMGFGSDEDCTIFIDQYIVEITQFLRNEKASNEICTALGLCAADVQPISTKGFYKRPNFIGDNYRNSLASKTVDKGRTSKDNSFTVSFDSKASSDKSAPRTSTIDSTATQGLSQYYESELNCARCMAFARSLLETVPIRDRTSKAYVEKGFVDACQKLSNMYGLENRCNAFFENRGSEISDLLHTQQDIDYFQLCEDINVCRKSTSSS